MATLDDSPSLFSGQQWTDWADSVLPDNGIDADDDGEEESSAVEDSMKLRVEDMPLFGLCPSRDEFYLVVCDSCNQVVKPQAFQAHLDLRHGGKGGYSSTSSSAKSHHSSGRHSVSSKSHSKSHSRSHKSHHSSPLKNAHAHIPKLLPEKPCVSSELLGFTKDNNVVDSVEHGVRQVKHSVPTKASVKEPPQSLNTAANVGAQFSTEKVKDSKSKKNHALPFVKVERMPDMVPVTKQPESIGSARTSLTNGAIRGAKSPPLSMPLEAELDELTLKHCSSILPPNLCASPSPSSMDVSDPLPPEEGALASEINSAVSAILEPVSPVSDPEQEGSSYFNIATPASTLTTDTVTLATMTMSSTTVTDVTSTMSSFTFSNMGRPHFPMGSIRVNFSSTGVLSALTSNSNYNNNNVIKTTTCTSVSDCVKTSVCSNGSMESTISDIVKSTINASNSGGFKSLSPLVNSPVKSSPNFMLGHTSSIKSPPGFSSSASKSFSGSSKSGSKLSMGCSNVFKSLSSGTLPTASNVSPVSSSSCTTSTTNSLKKLGIVNKPDKIIPLKDREYDANKHCGVVVTETGKPCTRSLTCKSHALSLRRAVSGRRLPFDDLLQEHRDIKDAYMKVKAESKEAAAARKAAGGVTPSSSSKPAVGHMSPPSKSPSVSTTVPSQVTKTSVTVTLATSKSLSSPLFSPAHKPSLPIHRSSITSLQVTSPPPRRDSDALSRSGEKLLIDEGDEGGMKDDSYTAYHPRPIAACSYGARHHSSYGSGFGCHSFGRRSDHLRAAFLDLLERHLHPPPPKKLCVESNLPKENDRLHGSSDPYDFPSRNLLGGAHIIQGQPSIVTSPLTNKIVNKSKAKPNSTVSSTLTGSKPKLKDTMSTVKAPALTNSFPPGFLHSAKKRRGSGSGNSLGSTPQSVVNIGSSLGTAIVTTPSIIAGVGPLSNNASSGGGNHQFAIAIPNVNISGATLSQLNASLVASSGLKHAKNNVIKDMGLFVTGVPQEALLNGQYVQLGEVPPNQVQQVTLEDGSKATIHQPQQQPLQQQQQQQQQQQGHVIMSNSKTSSQPKFINSNEVIRALQAGKSNHLLANLPPNTLLLDGNLQPGTVLQPVSLTPASANPAVCMGSSLPQPSAAATAPSPHIRSGSVSPQVSTSPLPNGIIAASSDKDLLMSQRHTLYQSKGLGQASVQQQQQHRNAAVQPTSHIFPGAQLQNHNLTFQSGGGGTATTSVTNQMSASQVFTTQLTQLQMKNSNIHKSPNAVNKLTMQPMSLTIPFVPQGGVGIGVGGQQSTHALFITSEDAQKQGFHLHQTDQQAQSSPSNSLIS